MGSAVSVKRSRSASRVLSVLEMIARHQPIGVSELARLLDEDKSAVQRAIMTLADDGWVNAAQGAPTRWRLTGHIHAVAHMAHSSNDLRQRARRVLEDLRNESGESVFLTTPDLDRFVVIDVLESRQLLRTAPHVGMVVLPTDSATGRAVLPHMSAERQAELLGGPPDAIQRAEFAVSLAQGYFVSDDDVIGGSINIAAPIFEVDGQPVGAVVISGPRERLTAETHARFGAMVARAAHSLSRAVPAAGRAAPAPTPPTAVSVA
jgi:IclR family acetate operon transcriptional repressor